MREDLMKALWVPEPDGEIVHGVSKGREGVCSNACVSG